MISAQGLKNIWKYSLENNSRISTNLFAIFDCKRTENHHHLQEFQKSISDFEIAITSKRKTNGKLFRILSRSTKNSIDPFDMGKQLFLFYGERLGVENLYT